MADKMPTKTMVELEIECLKVLKRDPRTREITRVGIGASVSTILVWDAVGCVLGL